MTARSVHRGPAGRRLIPTWAAIAALAGLGGLTAGGCGGSPMESSPSPAPTPTPDPPNLVVVLVDDLDVVTTNELPRIFDLVAAQGMDFTRAYVSLPLCSPARASLLTGRLPHNHGIFDNYPPFGGFPVFRPHEGSTIATWLHGAGYRTSLVGKYINDFPRDAPDEYIPPGWDDWYGHLSAYEDGRYFNYSVNDNGLVLRHGAEPEDYSVDVEAERAVRFIRESAGRPEPLFLLLAPEAPHIPANYAARHGSEFRYSLAPRVPSFNESDVRDKPAVVRQVSLLTDAEIDRLDRIQQWRLRSMRAVEEMVEAVLQALDETGCLENTYLFFTSDNGLLMGQHRLAYRKGLVYEESIRIPLMVRGPGVRGRSDQPVMLMDLAPTLLELAGVAIPEDMDARSLVPLLRGEQVPWRTGVLIDMNGTLALRTPDWLYAEVATDELELYDMRADPYQLESLHRDVDPAFLETFSQRIQELHACRGASCRE
jgi:N-acetylglucosamine-6-sulfatase